MNSQLTQLMEYGIVVVLIMPVIMVALFSFYLEFKRARIEKC